MHSAWYSRTTTRSRVQKAPRCTSMKSRPAEELNENARACAKFSRHFVRSIVRGSSRKRGLSTAMWSRRCPSRRRPSVLCSTRRAERGVGDRLRVRARAAPEREPPLPMERLPARFARLEHEEGVDDQPEERTARGVTGRMRGLLVTGIASACCCDVQRLPRVHRRRRAPEAEEAAIATTRSRSPRPPAGRQRPGRAPVWQRPGRRHLRRATTPSTLRRARRMGVNVAAESPPPPPDARYARAAALPSLPISSMPPAIPTCSTASAAA